MADASHLTCSRREFLALRIECAGQLARRIRVCQEHPHRTFQYGSPLKIENHCARLTNDICTRTPARALSEERSNQDLRTITESAYETLARQIKRELNLGAHKHCAIHEHELQRLWPLNVKAREAKIARFAKEHGFRLRFYRKGCARYSTTTANDSTYRYEVRSGKIHRGVRSDLQTAVIWAPLPDVSVGISYNSTLRIGLTRRI
jgi:hypothetical protein